MNKISGSKRDPVYLIVSTMNADKTFMSVACHFSFNHCLIILIIPNENEITGQMGK